ncbi:MAG: cysteine--tRNA ligase [Candidatus Thermoplasmatota archaeon]|nr:cysteine--tRNA ligase [Candidatus Thermoplasmatota archaeon]
MPLTIYNSLSRTKEQFTPVKSGVVSLYVCGMTVYSDTHIGHARTYVAFDVIRRYLEYKGHNVTYVQNITDVDDKIIAAANQQGVDPLVYSQRFTLRCLEDLDALGVRRADLYPKASEAIPDMVTMIQQIIQNGYGYVADGDVYFSVEAFPAYGRLSGQNITEMKTGARIEPGEQKHNPLDFALWKKAKPGEPTWPSPWSQGRPGWHIECSTMSSKLLGAPFDIHGGGMDLRFPHHENEIAQAEAATGKPFANYWMHIGLLTINGEKMSKSLGNIINVKDILGTWDAEVLRMFFASAHYRSPPDFSDKALTDIKKGLDRLYRLKERLEQHAAPTPEHKLNASTLNTNENQYLTAITLFQNEFEAAMDDDFNTPKAFACLFDFVNTSNKFFDQQHQGHPALCRHALDTYLKIGDVLTLFQPKATCSSSDQGDVIPALQKILQSCGQTPKATTVDELLNALLAVREDARKHKDWKTADHIRKHLEELGFEIQDTASGPVWRNK